MPKSTQSDWFSNLELPLSIQKILREKDRLARKQFVEFNRRRTQIIQVENQKIKQSALREVDLLSKRELMLIGAGLY